MASAEEARPPRLQPPVVSDEGKVNIIVFSVLEFLALTLIVLRFMAKRLNKKIGIDDWLILVALVFELGVYVSGICIKTVGYDGFHMDQLYPDQIETYLKVRRKNML